jgi:hypothetical protein
MVSSIGAEAGAAATAREDESAFMLAADEWGAGAAARRMGRNRVSTTTMEIKMKLNTTFSVPATALSAVPTVICE